MKKILSLLALIPTMTLFSQWNFVGTESFTPEGCSSIKISKYDWGGLVVCADPYDGVSSRYVHPYVYNSGTMEWDTLYTVINHPVFSTFDLWPDIEASTVNEWFIYTFAGPNKSYLYQSNIGTQNWVLVDSVDVDHVDLETGSGGDVWMSGYGNIYDHHFGMGSHTTYTFPTLMSANPIAVNNDEPVSFHASNSYAYEVNHLSGGSFSELDSLNYGTATTEYDIEFSDSLPVTVHLDPNTNQILLKKYNGSTWDQIYVNSGTTYTVGEVAFNLGIQLLTGDIVLGVHHYTTVTGPSTTNTIDVFKISSDLSTETSLGTAATFTYGSAGALGKFDVEVHNNMAYVAYVNFGDSNKASVKTYDLSTLSFKEVETYQFHLFPNPSNGQLNVITAIDNYTLEVFDFSGKLVYTDQGSNNFNTDLSHLQKGAYIVQFKDSGALLATEKLIIQ